MAESLSPSPGAASLWDQRYRDGTDAWELGQPAPPLAVFLQGHSCAPQPPGRVLVPGCGRSHEAALLADRGGRLLWLPADLFDAEALAAAGLATASLDGVLDNRFCVVMLSVLCHGRAVPLLWQTLEHPSASVSAQVVIALLEKAELLLAGFEAITLLADRGFPSTELLGWFEGRHRWGDVMRLRSDTWIHGAGAPLGCEVRKLQLQRGQCRGFWNVQLWADRSFSANLVLAFPTGLPMEEPWYLVSNLNPSLDLVWTYGQRFCCEQLFRDQKSGIFQLESSGLQDPGRIDRLLLVVAIAVLAASLQGYAVSLGGQRRRVDPHWKRGMSFLRIGLSWLQQCAANAGYRLLAWRPIPLRQLEPCIPSRGVYRRRKQPWFTSVDLLPQPRHSAPLAVA